MVLRAAPRWRRSLPLLLGTKAALAWQLPAPLRFATFRSSSLGEASEDRLWSLASSLSVTSAANARVKAAKQLHSSNGRKKTGLVLLEGLRLCCDALEASGADPAAVPPPTSVLLDPAALASPEGPRLEAALQRLPWLAVATVPPDVLADVATTATPQGVLLCLPRPTLPWDYNAKLLLVLDGVRDPGNLGTLVRSAAACGCGGVLLVGGCTDPWATKALRSSMGASLRVPLASAPDWPAALATYLAPTGATKGGHNSGGPVWLHAADARPAAKPYGDVNWAEGRHALVVGAEAAGLSPWVRHAAEAAEAAEAADAAGSSPGRPAEAVRVGFVSIPLAAAPHSWAPPAAGAGIRRPAVESLNAAVAGSVVLCEAHRQITAAGRQTKK